MWVRFSRDWSWRAATPRPLILSYRAGRAYSVVTACGRQAVAEGAAQRMKAPRRGLDPNLEPSDGAGS